MGMDLRKFVIPEIISGRDSRLLVGRYLSHFTSRKPLLVTDKNIREQAWFQDIIMDIEKHTSKYQIFDDITENPKDYEAMLGAEVFLSADCDLVIAIGGGSPMDCAKAIAIVATNGGHVLDYEGVDEVGLPGPPLICIPSTSGTAADVSQFSIILDTDNEIKKAIISKKVVPDLALIDPVPLMTMPSYLSACTGMDALTHAIEAYVSTAHSPVTDVHALEAVRIISKHLESAVKKDRTEETMYQMMIGSTFAGFAFSNASLGAVHAMAHALGGRLGFAHGECNAVLLEHVINYNYDAAPERYKDIAMALGKGEKNRSETKPWLLETIRQFRSQTGIRSSFETNDISKDFIDRLSQDALDDPCMLTNPKDISIEKVGELYGSILQKK